MTPLWTSEEAAKATNGKNISAWKANGISIDSRSLEKGDLFVAIVGPNNDGHDYLEKAAASGAAAAIIDQDHAKLAKTAGLPCLIVQDCLQALRDLASAARKRTNAKVIGVTGSVGKTGTKESLALALGEFGKVHATVGNLNNEFGLPLTMARMPANTEFAILEMGMNHPGEIEPLSRLAEPDVVVITTVQAVHLEYFDSIHDIADAKAEIFAGLKPDGKVLLPRDHPLFHYLRAKALLSHVDELNIHGFGAHPEADYQLLNYRLNQMQGVVKARCQTQELNYRLAMPGRHWALNSLIVLGAADCFGVDPQMAANALIRLEPPKGRGAQSEVHLPDGGSFTLIDESYNASPAAMKAAFAVLSKSQPGKGGRKIAVLGDMLELGDSAPELHARLAQELEQDGIDLVYPVGPIMAHLRDALDQKQMAGYAATSTEIISPVVQEIHDGDVVMIKGSLGSNMAPVVNALKALGTKSNGLESNGGSANAV